MERYLHKTQQPFYLFPARNGIEKEKMSFFRDIPLLGQKAAAQLDIDLMTVPGFSIDQLMELAGLSVASAIYDAYPNVKCVLAIAGPGNNGGDAFVAARHLKHFGMEPHVILPKKVDKPLFTNLSAQMDQLNIKVSSSLPDNFEADYELILDGIFGFSFNPDKGIRPPFDDIISSLIQTTIPIVSIDIPSGWHVEKGPSEVDSFLQPDMLISLTAPKLCAKYFNGKHHYLGGRFVPPFIREKYSLQTLPEYEGSSQFIKLQWEHNKCV